MISPRRSQPLPWSNAAAPPCRRISALPPACPSANPQGGGQQARAVDPHAAVSLGAIDAPQPHAAAMPTGAAGAVHQLVAQQRQRILHLQRLHRQVGGVGDVDVHAVQPVLAGPRAEAAADRLQIDPDAVVRRKLADEGDRGAGAVAARRSPAPAPPAPARRWIRSTTRWQGESGRSPPPVQRSSRTLPSGAVTCQRPGEPGVRQDGRVHHRLDRVVDGRQQRRSASC